VFQRKYIFVSHKRRESRCGDVCRRFRLKRGRSRRGTILARRPWRRQMMLEVLEIILGVAILALLCLDRLAPSLTQLDVIGRRLVVLDDAAHLRLRFVAYCTSREIHVFRVELNFFLNETWERINESKKEVRKESKKERTNEIKIEERK